MRRPIAIYGATEESVQLIPHLLANPEIEIAGIFDPDPGALRERIAALEPAAAESVSAKLLADAQDLGERGGCPEDACDV